MTDLSGVTPQDLLILPEMAISFATKLADRVGGAASRSAAPSYDLRDGIAVVPVQGGLVNRGSWLDRLFVSTNYKTLAEALDAALADSAVRGILLDLDTPGGEAAGAMETAALVRAASQRKPVVAYVDGLAASAGYAIAAAASHVVTTPSAQLGSIGVVRLHVDVTEAARMAGVKPTLIHAGAYKVDGSGFRPLDGGSQARMQASVDAIYDLFVASVAGHRGLSEKAVRGTEAGMFMGAHAVRAGLADEVGTLAAAFAYFGRDARRKAGVRSMRESESANQMPDADAPAADLPAASLPAAASPAAVPAPSAADERARIAAIISAPEAAGRENMARHLAFGTSMTAADAVALLATAPAAAPAPAARASSLAAAVPRPAVAPDQPASLAGSDITPWAAIFDDLNRRESSCNRTFVAPV